VLGGDPRSVVRYDSVDQVEHQYGVSLWRPKAVPAPWAWPPSRIRVSPGRVDWVQFVFDHPTAGGLTACQTTREAHAEPAIPHDLLPSGTALQSEALDLYGRALRVRRMMLENGAIVHEAWWREGGRHVMLRSAGSLEAVLLATETAFGHRP